MKDGCLLSFFKHYAGLWFFDGALLDDADQVLINAQEGKTRGMRQWRFQGDEVINTEQVQAYVTQAIDNAKAGKHITPKAKAGTEVPELLACALARDTQLAAAFADFTASKQREFSEYITGAKQAATREKRLAKITPMIVRGEGLNDRYRK